MKSCMLLLGLSLFFWGGGLLFEHSFHFSRFVVSMCVPSFSKQL